jgi:AcrR family transcriptional regulator
VDDRREELLEIWTEIFGARPYDQVSIDDIAERAGISKGLLYHYYPSKRDYYVAGVKREVDRVFGFTQPDPGLPPLERTRASIDAYLDYAEQHAEGIASVHTAGVGADEEVRLLIDGAQARQTERLMRVIVGDAEPSDVLRLAIRGWFGFLVTSTVQWLQTREIERDKLRDLIVQVLMWSVASAMQVDPSIKPLEPNPLDA